MTSIMKLLSLALILIITVASCNKDCGEKTLQCTMDNCYICQKDFDNKDKNYILDELGNKFFYDKFATDNTGKYYLDDSGNKLYCSKDGNGGYYTNTNNDKVYFKYGADKKVEKYVLSPLVYDNDCGYIIKGKVKYLIDGVTSAIIDYGDGEVDAWAVKTIYLHKDGKSGKFGKGKKEYTKCCKFEQKCKSSLDEGNETNTYSDKITSHN